MIEAVLFDMDGVLIDSQPMHYLGDQKTLQSYGVEASIDEMIAYAGTTNQFRFSLFKEKYGLNEEINAMIARREETMIDIVRSSGALPVRGIPELIALFKERGWKLAVASSSSYPFIYATLEVLGLKEAFDLIFSGESVPNGKPAPDVFLETADRLAVPYESCLVIEDSHNGVLAGKAAGMKVIGYQNPTSGKQDLSYADVTIHDFTCVDDSFLKKME